MLLIGLTGGVAMGSVAAARRTQASFATFLASTHPSDLSLTGYRLYGLRFSNGARGVPAVEREIVAALPPGTTYTFHITSVVEGQVDRAVKPEAIALAVFGIIAMAAALLIAVQVIARQLQATDEDTEVLRALGASPAMTMGEGLLGILGAIVLGSLLPGRYAARTPTALVLRTE